MKNNLFIDTNTPREHLSAYRFLDPPPLPFPLLLPHPLPPPEEFELDEEQHDDSPVEDAADPPPAA